MFSMILGASNDTSQRSELKSNTVDVIRSHSSELDLLVFQMKGVPDDD